MRDLVRRPYQERRPNQKRENGVVDGSGGELREADVAIRGGRIAEVGRVSGRGHEEIGRAH